MTLVRGARGERRVARVVATRALPGVRAGSGLVRVGERLLVVQDDAFAIVWVDLRSFESTHVPLRGHGGALEKPLKPDFEVAMRGPGGEIFLLGSGSTERRCTIARLVIGADGAVDAILSERPALYDALSVAAELGGRPNVEGAMLVSDRLVMLHRGAGAAPSAIVELDVDALDGAPPIARACASIDLGRLDGVPLSFTDATRVGERTYFLAAAEDTDDAIEDGAVAGSVIGTWTPRDAGTSGGIWTPLVDAEGRVIRCKAEGLAIDDDGRAAWVVTDPDDPAVPANLLRVVLDGDWTD